MEAVYINEQKNKPLMNKVFGVTSPLLALVDPEESTKMKRKTRNELVNENA